MTPALLALALAACEQDFTVQRFKATLEVQPQVTDLGTVAPGTTTDFTLRVVSLEGGDVTLTAVDVANQEGEFFAFTGELPEVPEGGSAELALAYAPLSSGYHWAEVVVAAGEAAEEVTAQVRGRAADAAASVYPSLVDFGPVPAGSTGQAALHLVNDGPVPVSLEAMDLTPRVFALADALPLSVEPGAEAILTLTYDARDEEPVLGTATLTLSPTGLDVGTVSLAANNCLEGDASLYDADGDGWAACGNDCDDTDAAIHPGGAEVCDGADQDCDGLTDEGTECYDDDGDGQTEQDGDCNDGDPAVHLGAPEDYANGIDDDCDGVVDSNMVDADGDGYAPEGGDCDDREGTTHPGAEELPDGVDQDCDGLTDEGTSVYDDDGDGFSEAGGDCDDGDASAYPGAPETADWVDDDCDGQVDEGTTYADDDGDGWTEAGGDCDDGSARINPAANEVVGDGVDNDCDGIAR